MTPAEFKTVRESLGLTAQWIADHANVRLRTVQYWEAGRMAVPEDVATLLADIDHTLESTVAQTLELVADLTTRNGVPAEIMLVRYRSDEDLWRSRPDMKPLPATTHAAMLSRLRRQLHSLGILSVIEFMRPDEYLAWLDGRPDAESERAAWVATLQDKEVRTKKR